MRTAIFVGLLYVAYAINPELMESFENGFHDVILVGITFLLAISTDVVELINKINE